MAVSENGNEKRTGDHRLIFAIDAVIFLRTALDRRVLSVRSSNGAMAEQHLLPTTLRGRALLLS